MSLSFTWYGHATWSIDTGDHKIVIDPFFDDSPTSPLKSHEVEADFILVSHGHFDHISDAAPIAARTHAKVIAIFEIAKWLEEKHGIQNTLGMNIGGSIKEPFGTVKMTPAHHSSQLPDGAYGGVAAGFIITIRQHRLYFACDTALFGEMKWFGESGIDVAFLPIGDLFTMGPDDSVTATKWLNPKLVLPQHYNTWPAIEQDANGWARLISEHTEAKPIVLKPGESYEL